ncbi:MAG: Adenosylmethionine-8-amino-7-oxononanoate aminotransferase [Desulfovibrio sp.]
MPDALCIIGTDTDAGKTFVVSALAKAAADKNHKVLIVKPVQTGCTITATGEYDAPDLTVYQEAAPQAVTHACEVFAPACSPHLAARGAGRSLSVAALAAVVRETAARHRANTILIEGAGGLFTPLSETETMADLLSLLNFPVLLVVGNKLGAVNHALMTIEACKTKGLTLSGFVLTDTAPAKTTTEKAVMDDNASIIATLGGITCLARVEHVAGLDGKSEERARAWEKAAESVRPVLDAMAASGDGGAEELLIFDREHIWHPYTSVPAPSPAWEAVKTRGARITLRGGRELVDGMASWWCAVHGYNHPALMDALHAQAGKMPHVMFGGLTHEPAVTLARKLLALSPRGLEHVFFADSGSVSVEVALKMALQYQMAAGRTKKNRILAVRGGYHGDTLGAMSVCDPDTGMHHLFSTMLPVQFFALRPECRFDAPYDPAPFAAFEAELAARAETVAAVILEPIVQGAGGMWFYHPEFLRDVKRLCERHGCLLILDEVATGFGRTGALFACEHAGITPDIMCVGKGLTGGVMSLAATLATREVAEGISRDGGVLMHGPTFMGNPLACAVAGASLALLAEGAWKKDVPRIEAKLKEGLLPCSALPGVKDARVLGAIGVLEMERPVATAKLQEFFVNRGVWIRPFARLIYVMPPYVTSDADIETLTRAMRDAVSAGVWN